MTVDERTLALASIRDLGRMIRDGDVTPTRLAEHAIARLESAGRRLNAVVTITRERALREARQAEEDLAEGIDRGPLHGIPYGAKDLLATAGIPTTWGAAPFKDQVFDEDATVIRRLSDQACDGRAGRRHGLRPPERLAHRSRPQPLEP
jgi:aspartyl-tRNA(Asn)/glutamyl-tRNA(Gln) amidotransferase subunit A